MKKNCEDCIDTDIADWEINENTGKATPVLWCERYKKFCSDISECGKEGRNMAKRELIDRKALIDNGLSKDFCEWYDEIKQAEVITEQDIVKPYLEKLKEQVSHCNLCLLVNKEDVLGFIDNLLSESEGCE